MKGFFSILSIALSLLLLANFPSQSQVSFNKVISPFGEFTGLVGGIAQDKNGYMWFATKGGLYKYDGYRFKTYLHDPSDTNSISTSDIEKVYADSNGVFLYPRNRSQDHFVFFQNKLTI